MPRKIFNIVRNTWRLQIFNSALASDDSPLSSPSRSRSLHTDPSPAATLTSPRTPCRREQGPAVTRWKEDSRRRLSLCSELEFPTLATASYRFTSSRRATLPVTSPLVRSSDRHDTTPLLLFVVSLTPPRRFPPPTPIFSCSPNIFRRLSSHLDSVLRHIIYMFACQLIFVVVVCLTVLVVRVNMKFNVLLISIGATVN